MPADPLALLIDSLHCLEREAPEAALALKQATGAFRAKLSTEGVARILALQGSEWTLLESAGPSDLEVRFERSVVPDLAEGRLSLEQALVSERLHVLGAMAAAERLHDALMIYLEGLMRAPGATQIYRRYCEP